MRRVDPRTSGPPAPPPTEGASDPGTAHRVVVVDDHELLRTGTRRILEDAPGFSVVGEAGDGEAALQVIKETDPELVLVDIRLPTINGIDLARRIGTDFPKIKVLILTAYDDENYVRAALAAGVTGYLLKTMPADDLIRSIEAACDGSNPIHIQPSGRGEKGDSPGTDQSHLTVPRARGGTAGLPGHVQQGYRPATCDQPEDRRGPSQSHIRQTRHCLPDGVGALCPGQQSLRSGSTDGSPPVSKTAVFGAENLPQGPGVPRQTDEPAPQIDPPRPRARNQPSARKTANQKPWTNSRFWILQFIILALYLIRLAATVTFHLDATSPAVEFSTVELFVVPVIYGTLNYGLDGALLTAGWVTMLAVPRFLTALVNHNYVRRGLS